MICKRCGVNLKAINYRHIGFCNRMPLPRELAEEYLDSGRTYTEMAAEYDCSSNSLRQRVLLGLALLKESPRPIGRRPDNPAGPCDTAVEEVPHERCGCGIILTKEQAKRGTCDFCAGVTFDYMQFRREETAVQRAIPVSVSLSI